jgi:hypothetical protein
MLVLVKAKRSKFMEELEADDPRLLMNSEMTKWKRISSSVSVTEWIECINSAEACKYKWQTLLPDYKRIADLYKETGLTQCCTLSCTTAKGKRGVSRNFLTCMSTLTCTNG